MNPAPAFSLNSRTGMVNPVGAPRRMHRARTNTGFCHADRQMSVAPRAYPFQFARCLRCHVQVVGLVHALGNRRCFVQNIGFWGKHRHERSTCCDVILHGFHHCFSQVLSAFPAFGVDFGDADRTAPLSQHWAMAANSASVSDANRLMETTTGTPNAAMLRMCRSRLVLAPRVVASTFSASRVALSGRIPPVSKGASVKFHRANGDVHDHAIRCLSRRGRLDVHEFLGAHV